MTEIEEPLAGGGLGGAVRVGDTVRREPGSWNRAVHGLLGHLERVGFDGAPRVVGFDDKGREVLTFIDGSSRPATGPPDDDAGMLSAARLLRRYHDAVEGYAPRPDAPWQYMVGAPREGPIVCHNDPGPTNTVYVAGHARAFIDWDFAAPATREWDLAYALYRYVPLYDDAFFERRGVAPPDRARRLRMFCDEYGCDDRSELIGLVRRRIEVLYDSVRTWGEQGLRHYAQIWTESRGAQWLETIEFLDRNRDAWERALA